MTSGLPVTRTTSQCYECKQVFSNRHIVGGYCQECHEIRRDRIARELEMSDRRQTAQFSRELLSRIKNVGSDKQVLDQVFAKFTELIGGPDGLATKLKEDFDKVRGDNLSPKEQVMFERKDSVIVKYWQLILSLQEKLDDRNNVDASGLTDEDLQATLAQLAAQLIRTDADFRTQVLSITNNAQEEEPEDVPFETRPATDEEPSWD
jgi:hypothetical protein